MSPLLFLIYANDLSAECEPIEGIKISMYADDVAVWAHEKSRDSLQSKIQMAADKVVQWSKKWKLLLSAGKCEVAFFSTNTHEAHWQPNILINGERLAFNDHPKFLGLHYDRQLTFGYHY